MPGKTKSFTYIVEPCPRKPLVLRRFRNLGQEHYVLCVFFCLQSLGPENHVFRCFRNLDPENHKRVWCMKETCGRRTWITNRMHQLGIHICITTLAKSQLQSQMNARLLDTVSAPCPLCKCCSLAETFIPLGRAMPCGFRWRRYTARFCVRIEQ